ncbi:MAG: hypothetical protein WA610_07745 [Thermodesulfovibrionales bacterium]
MEEHVKTQAQISTAEISVIAAREASLNKARLLNSINYIHSQGKSIYVVFRHLKYNTTISVEAAPGPCGEDYLYLAWKNSEKIRDRLHLYEIEEFHLGNSDRMFSFHPRVVAMDGKGISLDLSIVACKNVGLRKAARHPCRGIEAEIIQHGLSFRGQLKDFSAVSFSVMLSLGKIQSFADISMDIPPTISLRKEEELLYSGQCRTVRHDGGTNDRTFAFEPVAGLTNRFKSKKHRSPRHRLNPSPNLFFIHPLTGKPITLKIHELAGSGFSVIENYETAVLIPGMILSTVEIEFAFGISVTCRAQVITRRIITDSVHAAPPDTCVLCGVVILDMDSAAQKLVASLLHQATNSNSSVCSRVDPDELWEFFFKSGFIYPKKYIAMHGDIDKIKETLRKLYLENSDIARHFVYREDGKVQGHLSMIRFYEKTWLFHHHASTGTAKAGIVVLDQICRYVNDFCHMHSAHLDYIVLYFRPENRFPRRVFGGFQKHISNNKACSLDDFAHLLFKKNGCVSRLADGMTLKACTQNDLDDLTDYYAYASGGLMLNAFELTAIQPAMTIRKVYENIGMKRNQLLFSLREDNSLKAVFIVNLSDLGLNMSNLMNCITVMVLDNDLSSDNFVAACNDVVTAYAAEEVTVLVYPVSYAEKQGLSRGKVYTLWSFSTQYADEYLEFLNGLKGRH